ncbi:MAG: hypothetical protein ABIZ04_14410 [Opitutus sp.]
MHPVLPSLTNILWLPVAIGLFLAPGWLLSLRIGSPAPGITSFLGSTAILYLLALATNALGMPLHVGTLSLGLALVAALLYKRGTSEANRLKPVSAPTTPSRWNRLWVISGFIALVSITARALLDPLSGYDNGTRWDYLARLFLTHASFAGYPPTTATDFEYYSWCDGIPPLIPLLNLWTYAVTGSIAPILTGVRVVGEALLLGALVFRYSRLLWGAHSGGPAVAVFATSALALWSVAMGQETGLTAISLVSMLYFLELNARAPNVVLVVWAALAAGLAAATREYGLAFPVLGFLILLCQTNCAKSRRVFVLVAIVIAAPWYLRNWVITGNPLYPQTLGGLFPGNPVHDELMRSIADYWGFRSGRFFTPDLARSLCVLTGLLVPLGLMGVAKSWRRSLPLIAAIGLVVGLWLWSVPQTAGGWIYSTRMLSPALALSGVLAGWIGTLAAPLRVCCVVLCAVTATDAARRSWFLPALPLERTWPFTFSAWRETRSDIEAISSNLLWPVLIRDAAGKGIVVDHTAHHALVTMRGGRAIPLFSPILADTFKVNAPFAAIVAQLRRDGVKYITISARNYFGRTLISAHPFWSELCLAHTPTAIVQDLDIFDLDDLLPAPSKLAP